MRYFPSAAAAAEAGFRPCLRCRPECSPGTPGWAGTRNTVSRALQLINESGLKNGGVERLAERLGVGSRHLRRLFVRHLGATPSAVAQTRRLHFAKKLLDETRLAMGEVAVASGFPSVRQFNATIRNVYHRTPTKIRRLARQRAEQPENHYLFHLCFRPPYNWKRILEILGAGLIPGVEAVDSERYLRTIAVGGDHGYIEVLLDEPKNALAVRIQLGDTRSLFSATERIRSMFDLNADWDVIARTLKADPVLARLLKTEEGLRVPGCWSGFELTVYAILAEANPKQAAYLAGSLVRGFGERFPRAGKLTHVFPQPEILAQADLIRIGLPKTSAAAISALARSVCRQEIRFDGSESWDSFRSHLCEICGIERQTAEYVAMRALRDPDAFPNHNLPSVRRLSPGAASTLERRSEAWRPWRAYAALLLWQAHHSRILPAVEPNFNSGSRRQRCAGQQPRSVLF